MAIDVQQAEQRLSELLLQALGPTHEAIDDLATILLALKEARTVCGEAYQAVGSMLDDLDMFDTERAQHILDNLSQASLVHNDVLPWPSFKKE